MQVTPPVPLPLANTVSAQDTAAKMVQQAQSQVIPTVTQRAVGTSPKAEGDNRPRSNGDKAKGGDGNNRGGKVNLRV